MCTFGLSGCCVKPRRLRGRRGFTQQPENSKRAHLALPNTTKKPRLGLAPPFARTLCPPPFGPHPSGHLFSGPTVLGWGPPTPDPKKDWPKMDWTKLDWQLVKSGWPKRDWPKSVPSELGGFSPDDQTTAPSHCKVDGPTLGGPRTCWLFLVSASMPEAIDRSGTGDFSVGGVDKHAPERVEGGLATTSFAEVGGHVYP